ncbi:probable leucine--tRNA ligase, mitochondrial [Contarinia nasturtii]|uniref:probable leucine--tRNA ligase, mitochondrial n=1 Tax=Contarinia nasturtii TaxID=265458 RepID=UPI0012D39F86|nr:probable leucine--tRNA ligase, mitochondrial [Contarinia nasturtii]
MIRFLFEREMRILQLNTTNLSRYQNLIRHRISFYSTEGCTNFTQTKLTTEIKHNIENHWRDKIKQTGFDESKPDNKYVVIPQFPYPSGHLHLGHVRVYTISDAIARFYRLKGKNVLHPIGFDAFGLPAENAAIERKISPAEWTKANIEHMRKQLVQLGASFDWKRELVTCDSKYYKWTQWIFLQMLKNGLAYQRKAFVNWDPVDGTVLANEQVDENCCSWRSGAKVEKKLLKQWFLRTTNFAKDLYDGLDNETLEDWDDVIKMQKNWFGKPTGYKFQLDLFYVNSENQEMESIDVWTTMPEQMLNPGFIAIKSNHFLSQHIQSSRVLDVTVKNPFKEGALIPLVVCDELEYQPHCETYIGLPAVNEIDRNLTDKLWISYENLAPDEKNRESILKKAKSKQIGGYPVSPHFTDWLISRQRFWGCPVPIIHCEKCGSIPVPDSSLPVHLPEATFDEIGKPIPLSMRSDWYTTKCHKCGNLNAKRETDTFDTFVDSSWYFLRYLNPDNAKVIFDKSLAKEVMPVDMYIGGIEHAVLHLYMARFFMHFFKKAGYVTCAEPFKRLVVQGMINGRTFCTQDGRHIKEEEVNILNEKQNRAEETVTGMKVHMEWEKMSKSKKNGVDPTELFNEYSVDSIRLIMLADVLPRSARNWSKDTFPGILKWQQNIWLCLNEFNMARTDDSIIKPENITDNDDEALKLFELRNYCVSKAGYFYSNAHFSSAIKICQELTDELRKFPKPLKKYNPQYERALADLFIMFSPIAPLFASECWSKFLSVPNRVDVDGMHLKWDKDALDQHWPTVDENINDIYVLKINSSKTIFHRTENDPETITEQFLMQKANEMTSFTELLKTHKIKRKSFTSGTDKCTTLVIHTEKKIKDKKKKQKIHLDSEAIQ